MCVEFVCVCTCGVRIWTRFGSTVQMFSSCIERAGDSHWKDPDDKTSKWIRDVSYMPRHWFCVVLIMCCLEISHVFMIPVLCRVCPDGSYTVIYFPFHTTTKSCQTDAKKKKSITLHTSYTFYCRFLCIFYNYTYSFIYYYYIFLH